MSKRVFKNAKVLCPDIGFKLTDVTIENGIILSTEKTELEGEDCTGKYIIPGLVDIHTHGCVGTDFSNGNRDENEKALKVLAQKGTTSILAAVMTQSEAQMLSAAEAITSVPHKPGHCRVEGIYMEGPFFSHEYRGAQHPDHLKNPDLGLVEKMQRASGGAVKILSLAPEKPGSVELISSLRGVKAFLGHTAADFDTAKSAIDAGAEGLTHTFNCMPPLHHRNPGLLGAALGDRRVVCECICDGLHVHPCMVKLLYTQIGASRFCIVSDSIASAFLPDGEYISGGQRVFMKGGCARIESGAVAGSSCCMLDGVRNLVFWGVCSLENAVYSASAVPARAAGIYEKAGSIETGKRADLLILDQKLDLLETVISQ